MAEPTKPKSKSFTLSDEDISISRPKQAPPSLGRVGAGPDVVGVAGGKAGTDPDAAPKPAPTDPDGH